MTDTDKTLPRKKAANAPLPFQKELPLIEHRIEGEIVAQRPMDGYINATALCKKAGREFKHYNENKQTKDFVAALSAEVGIPTSALIQIFKGGNQQKLQGTWIHPQVAIHLAQWLSPRFAVQVSKWVFDWMQGMSTGYMPFHVKRYMNNRSKIPPTHFSMLNEIYLHLIAPLEDSGFLLPDKMIPDASTGRMFSGFLRKEGINVDSFPYYEHDFLDNKRPVVQARLYPLEYLPKFRNYFHNKWLPERSMDYFAERAPNALPHLRQIIAELPPPVRKIASPDS